LLAVAVHDLDGPFGVAVFGGPQQRGVLLLRGRRLASSPW
jgi:hypothetical protein